MFVTLVKLLWQLLAWDSGNKLFMTLLDENRLYWTIHISFLTNQLVFSAITWWFSAITEVIKVFMKNTGLLQWKWFHHSAFYVIIFPIVCWYVDLNENDLFLSPINCNCLSLPPAHILVLSIQKKKTLYRDLKIKIKFNLFLTSLGLLIIYIYFC